MSDTEASTMLVNSKDYIKEIIRLKAENEILKRMLKAAKLKIKQQEQIQNKSNKSIYLQKYT